MRQTSYATVAVLDDGLAAEQVTLRRSDPGVHVQTARGSGPGGQHRNTRDTAVRAWHDDWPGIVVLRNSGRSQTINVDDALTELSQRISEQKQQATTTTQHANRRAQSEPDVAFTHSRFAGHVREHATGRTWQLRAWEQGRF